MPPAEIEEAPRGIVPWKFTDVGTGMYLSGEPVPSWPDWFEPQQKTAFEVAPQEWAPPVVRRSGVGCPTV
jgi:hypothetical protein